MPRVSLPPGCYGFTFADGSKTPAVRKGTAVTLDDRQAAALAGSKHARIGMVTINPGLQLGTRKGRWCAPCRFLAQAWSTRCPRCDGLTEPEQP